MSKSLVLMLVISALLASPGLLAVPEASAQMRQAPAVRNMDITGEIAKSDYGYAIQGKVPPEVFTILNPVPHILDAFVKSGKTVTIKVRIVSGDNVEIETIDGKNYGNASGSGK